MKLQIDLPTLLLVLALSVMIIYVIKSYINHGKKKELALAESSAMRVFSVISCVKEDYAEEREYREGDFVGKLEGKCPRCGSELLVQKIYTTTPPVRREKGFLG